MGSEDFNMLTSKVVKFALWIVFGLLFISIIFMLIKRAGIL